MSNPLRFKVSEKGAVSVYGLGRFPVTLYREQWQRLLTNENVADLLTFISDNTAKLAVKATKPEKAPAVEPDSYQPFQPGRSEVESRGIKYVVYRSPDGCQTVRSYEGQWLGEVAPDGGLVRTSAQDDSLDEVVFSAAQAAR